MAKYTKFEQMSRVKQFYPKNPSLFCDITSNSQFENLCDFTEKLQTGNSIILNPFPFPV